MKKLIFLALALTAAAADVTLQWDASPSTNVTYRMYQWPATTTNMVVAATNITSLTFVATGVTNVTQFAVTAVDEFGYESDPSNVVTYTPPPKVTRPKNLKAITKPNLKYYTNVDVIIVDSIKE